MDTAQTTVTQPIKMTFDKLMNARSSLNSRFEDYAGWTLPYLYPLDELDADNTELQHDYQSVGAQATNHLANKISVTLFTPGRPFFRLDMTQKQLDELAANGIDEPSVDKMLSKSEKEGMKLMAGSKLRSSILTALKNIIVLGNALMYFPQSNSPFQKTQVYNLKDYVVERDMSGELTTLITRDNHKISTLPDDLRALYVAGQPNCDESKTVTIYTSVIRQTDKRFNVYQELEENIAVPGSEGTFAPDDLPWLPLTWNLMRGNNYGNGLVE